MCAGESFDQANSKPISDSVKGLCVMVEPKATVKGVGVSFIYCLGQKYKTHPLF